jgi:hypothetical protein
MSIRQSLQNGQFQKITASCSAAFAPSRQKLANPRHQALVRYALARYSTHDVRDSWHIVQVHCDHGISGIREQKNAAQRESRAARDQHTYDSGAQFRVEASDCSIDIFIKGLIVSTRGGNRMRESCTYGSVRGARGNSRPYRDSGLSSGLVPATAPRGNFLARKDKHMGG